MYSFSSQITFAIKANGDDYANSQVADQRQTGLPNQADKGGIDNAHDLFATEGHADDAHNDGENQA